GAATGSVGMITLLARSSAATTSGAGSAPSSDGGIHQPKSVCTVTSSGASGSIRSCRRTSSPTTPGPTTGSADPGSACCAQRSAFATSADRSPECACTCMPSRIDPSGRTTAAAAPGSTVASVTGASPGARSGSGAGEHRGERDGGVAVLAQRQGRGGRREELTHRDQVALRREPLERAGDDDVVTGAVARLVALARAAGARAAGVLTRGRRLRTCLLSHGGRTVAGGTEQDGTAMAPFDPGDPAFLADPYPTFAELRAQGPVHDHPLLGFPVAVSHAACSEVLRSRDLGRIWVDAEPAGQFPAFNLLHRNSLLEREGPPHDRLRRLVAGAFNRGHTARLEPRIRELAIDRKSTRL